MMPARICLPRCRPAGKKQSRERRPGVIGRKPRFMSLCRLLAAPAPSYILWRGISARICCRRGEKIIERRLQMSVQAGVERKIIARVALLRILDYDIRLKTQAVQAEA